jgi:hypothetical protein
VVATGRIENQEFSPFSNGYQKLLATKLRPVGIRGANKKARRSGFPRGAARQAPFKDSATLFWHTVSMLDEHQFTLRQIDQARGDLYAIADDLEFLKVQLARLPTRRELARTALGIIFCSAALVILWFEVWPPIR